MVRSANVRYSKVRPLHPLCQFDVCRHEVRYGCQREDSCSFAHSVIELKCWVLQQDTGELEAIMGFSGQWCNFKFHGAVPSCFLQVSLMKRWYRSPKDTGKGWNKMHRNSRRWDGHFDIADRLFSTTRWYIWPLVSHSNTTWKVTYSISSGTYRNRLNLAKNLACSAW